ncbi:DMT family transporter [Geodermatophilus sabuli]|uniref:Transporter family-2 protein n=1 Tax=Geodermatophilus sabuli TaxID=1564158 RepID=A0A285EI69_9ACTN|nr:DMT family transporter [Geodermatophilus sabuli]MBB3084050.1 transporter family-2 protein [Geodermatophilus sabuli]SNX98697.1 transporter family-2 protein [Geodermatophilus sabuli]
MPLVFLASALLIGCLLAVQASVNQRLSRAVGTPFGAATLQLLIAGVVLGLVALATGAVAAMGRVPEVSHWWLLLGGVASPLYITAGILLFPRLGALVAGALFVTGQVFASLGLDLLGLLWVPRRPFGPGILLGALAVVAGVTVMITGSVSGRLTRVAVPVHSAAALASGGTRVDAPASPVRQALGTPTASRLAWTLLGLAAGAVLPVQGAINSRLEGEIGAPLAVATISFVVATATILVVLGTLLTLRRTPRPQLRPLRTMPWWGWLGGLCAAVYVTVTFLLIPVIGAAVTVALTVTGQQVASAVIDHRGVLAMPRRRLTAARAGGLLLLVAGSVLVHWS